MSEGMRERVAAILSEVLNTEISPEDHLQRTETSSWDSLNHIELILRLEELLQVRFTLKEVAEIQSMDHLIRIIGGKS